MLERWWVLWSRSSSTSPHSQRWWSAIDPQCSPSHRDTSTRRLTKKHLPYIPQTRTMGCFSCDRSSEEETHLKSGLQVCVVFVLADHRASMTLNSLGPLWMLPFRRRHRSGRARTSASWSSLSPSGWACLSLPDGRSSMASPFGSSMALIAGEMCVAIRRNSYAFPNPPPLSSIIPLSLARAPSFA